MIDPRNVTNYKRTQQELEEFWLFSIIVAGRNADMAAKKTKQLTDIWNNTLDRRGCKNIFDFLATIPIAVLQICKVGQYTRISQAIKESINLDLLNASVDELDAIHGVGPKTARFFVLHTRPNQEIAVLDTHILAYMRSRNMGLWLPKSTPQNSRTYAIVERHAIALLRSDFPGLTLAEADLEVWKRQSGRI